jgi:hypothetical protein
MDQQLLMDLGLGYQGVARVIYLGLKAQGIWYFLCKSQESKINYRKRYEVRINKNKI